MENNLKIMLKDLYNQFGLEFSNFEVEKESKAYLACQFQLNNQQIIFRQAKITPKKAGQFVTFWKRDHSGCTVSYSLKDKFDYLIIQIRTKDQLGHLIFSKETLADKGIISTSNKAGKRGFRVYANWDQVSNNLARTTQKWQVCHFIILDESTNLKRFRGMFNFN